MESPKTSLVVFLTLICVLSIVAACSAAPHNHDGGQAHQRDEPQGVRLQDATTPAEVDQVAATTHDPSHVHHDGHHGHDGGEGPGAAHGGPGGDGHRDGRRHVAMSTGNAHLEHNAKAGKLPTNAVVDYLASILSNDEVKSGLFRSLGSKTTGPFLLRPVVEMLCRALLANADDNVPELGQLHVVNVEHTPEKCDIDTAVEAIQQALEHVKDLDMSAAALPVQAIYEPMHQVFKALTHDDSAAGANVQAALEKVGKEGLSSLPGFQEGIGFILVSGQARSKQEPEIIMPSKLSIIQGALRLLLSDRDFEKTLFEAAHKSPKVVSSVAQYFYTKYGVVENQEVAEEIVKETVEGLLENWNNRAAMFEIMKLGFTKLTGKHMPLPYIMYSGLIEGIKSGDIDLPAILGYMEMAKLNPALIQKIANYDSQAYARFKHIYVPIYKFVREYFAEPTSVEFPHAEE